VRIPGARFFTFGAIGAPQTTGFPLACDHLHVTAPEWTEGRLDELSSKVDRGFERVDREFEKVDQRFEKVDQRLERISARLDGIQRTMVLAVIAITTTILGGFGAMIALFATRL
jgi:hypothetical protein